MPQLLFVQCLQYPKLYVIILSGTVKVLSRSYIITGRFASSKRKPNLFKLPSSKRREVMQMYLTIEELFLFCNLIVAIISLIVSIFHNKKR